MPDQSAQVADRVPTLAAGETYIGAIGDAQGNLHHVILLPGDAESISWEDAKAWAIGQGGELPTRREQSLLFANLKDRFEEAWYWSGQEHESDSSYAWCQYFGYGRQDNYHKINELRARAIRRIYIGNLK